MAEYQFIDRVDDPKMKPLGVADGCGNIISYCCHEGRHAECMGMTEMKLDHDKRIKCGCGCHKEDH